MRLKTRFVVIALMGLLLFALAAAGPLYAQDGDQPGDPDEGADLYVTYCYVCHGERGEGRTGATLSDIFVTIAPDVFLTDVISSGVEGSFMPGWSLDSGGPLTDEEVQHLVAYIESWGTTVEPPFPAARRPPVEIPPVEEIDGDPNNGYTVFQRECAGCHGEQGEGRVGATLNTTFAAISPGALTLDTIRQGVTGSLMPPFQGILSEEEINDVAAYVLSIQTDASARPGEQVGQGEGWPLLVVVLVVVGIIIVLGVTVLRRETRGSG